MIKFHTQEETDVDVLEEVLEDIGNQSQLVVYNDDHNTFDCVCLLHQHFNLTNKQ